MSAATLEVVSLDSSGAENGAIDGWKTVEWKNRLSKSGSLQVSGADLSKLSGYLFEVSKETNVPDDIAFMKSWVDGMRLAGVTEDEWETLRVGPNSGAMLDPDKVLDFMAESGIGEDGLKPFLKGGDKIREFDVDGIYPIGGDRMDGFQLSKLLLFMGDVSGDSKFTTAAMGVVYRAMVEGGMSGWREQGKGVIDALLDSVGGVEKAKNLILGQNVPRSYHEKCFVQMGKMSGFDRVIE